ncbi:WXG100 family type VII secretion target [Spirillospora sp. NBC_01491]|uniref:WXG100 family type VII secretion target n=1 Tax=Spirillospora sp. NBC_01491 TaxID=2976007 RepID=UPI002E3656D1|nr:WXG100 family type VII secretion target [Spirillospora sp. NBC_01491]
MSETTFVRFGGMKDAQANFLKAAQQYRAIVEALDAQVRKHLSEWDGDARLAYQRKSDEWRKAADHMQATANKLGQAIGDSHDIHAGAERANTGLWS